MNHLCNAEAIATNQFPSINLPPQPRIVLTFENPLDVVGAVGCFVNEISTQNWELTTQDSNLRRHVALPPQARLPPDSRKSPYIAFPYIFGISTVYAIDAPEVGLVGLEVTCIEGCLVGCLPAAVDTDTIRRGISHGILIVAEVDIVL